MFCFLFDGVKIEVVQCWEVKVFAEKNKNYESNVSLNDVSLTEGRDFDL